VRDSTLRDLKDAYQIRMGQRDNGHVNSLTQDEVEQYLRRVDSEAREDVYAQIGVEGVKIDEVAVVLGLHEAVALDEACSLAMGQWGADAASSSTPALVKHAYVMIYNDAQSASEKILRTITPAGRALGQR